MSRYIDADEVLEQIRKKLGIKSLNYLLEAERQIVDAIQSAPSIDIVRCKECKYHKPSKIWAEIKPCIVKPFPSMRCKMLNREVNDDDFCSYGEREGE